MTTRIFHFKGVHAETVKVNHNMAVGLPSLTGVTGLGGAFASRLAEAAGLSPTDLECTGVLFALEDYQLVDGYKKGYKAGSFTYEAIPAAWANFTCHFAFEMRATTDTARDLLEGTGLAGTAKAVLLELRLCKGRFSHVSVPVNLGSPKLARDYGDERSRSIAMLPSSALVVTEEGRIVNALREAQLPLMEGLIAASLVHSRRPPPFREFFAEHAGDGLWKLAVVQDGYLLIDEQGVGNATRPNYAGEQGRSHVVSPTLGLVRLQSAASLKLGIAAETALGAPFWSMQKIENSYFCTTTIAA